MKMTECVSPRKCRFSESKGAMLANSHDPYIQRGYPLLVIHTHYTICTCKCGESILKRLFSQKGARL